jgi:3'-phosphoadenosine 5'-phosphosulfate sulfotransferase (PAPS reductase)/FAD synthetase
MIEHNILGVSSGKDSTAMLLLAIERETPNLQAVFMDTCNEGQIVYEYIRYLSETVLPIRTVKADFSAAIARRREMMQRVIDGTFTNNRGAYEWTPEAAKRALEVLHPTGIPFLDMCLVHGRFPSTKVRFCTRELKQEVITNQVMRPLWDAGDAVISWQGVRAEESPARAELPMEEDVNQQYSIVRPILHWTAAQCFEMHRKHGISPNPLYSQGMARVGCMPCVNVRKDELLEISKRFPEAIERIEKWEELVRQASKTGSASFFPGQRFGLHSAAEVTEDNSGICAHVEWAKTSHGGKEYDLIRMIDDSSSCSSVYGLCE